MKMVGFCAFWVLLFTLDACFTRTNGVFGLPNVVFCTRNGAFCMLFWGFYVSPWEPK